MKKYKIANSKEELKEILLNNPRERHIKLAFEDASYLYQEVLKYLEYFNVSA